MKSRFSLILIACVLIFGGILLVSKKDAKSPDGSNSSTGQVTNHVKGDGKTGVTLVEYGDFECPACSAYYPLVEQVYEKYKGDITFQFRNFPLRQIHQHAMVAHRAAAAAARQGKFWEMYDLLYQNHDTWTQQSDPSSTFRSYAQSLGLDLTKYDTDFKSEAVNAEINADIAEGTKLGINSTPTFFVNGKKIDNPRDQAAFEKVITDAIAAKKQGQ
jgi:protein-disulfide isomerase